MNQHDQFDRTDAELEALLAATFASEAEAKVPDARPVPPFPATTRLATVHPIRRRWVGLSVVAASLVAVAVAATVIGSEAMTSEKAPVPAGTSVAPTPTVDATTTAAPTATSPTTPTSATTSPPATTKQLTVQGVTLSVPTAWNLATDPSGSDSAACLGVDPVEKSTGEFANNCELEVRVVQVGSAGGGGNVDIPFVFGEGGVCGSAPVVPQQTVTADQVTVDGEQAEHRVFTAPCVTGTIEQWTVATNPMVLFLRQRAAADDTGLAQAVAAVESATLPGPRSALRVQDHGLVRGFSDGSLVVDRVVTRYGAPVLNNNPATYRYPVADSTAVSYRADSPGSPSITLTAAQLQAMADGGIVAGVPALDTLSALVYTNGERCTSIALYGPS